MKVFKKRPGENGTDSRQFTRPASKTEKADENRIRMKGDENPIKMRDENEGVSMGKDDDNLIQMTADDEGYPTPLKSENNTLSDTKIDLEFNAFIPNDLNAEWYQDNKAWKKEPNPFSSKLFSSDDRTYEQNGTSRISHKATLVFDNQGTLKSHLFKSIDIGWSHQADPIREKIWVPPHPYKDLGGYYRDGSVIGIENIQSKKAGNKGENSFVDNSAKNEYELNMRGEASYPFSAFAPDIDFNATFYVSIKRIGLNYYAYIYIVGTRDNFPAYEGIVRSGGTRNDIYQQKVDKDDGPGMINLNTSEVFSSKILPIKLSDR